MSGGRVPDSERLLMESIRALEEEQLEVEEVDDDSRPSSSGDSSEGHGNAGTGPYGAVTFDTGLVSLHTYLGEVEDMHHKVVVLDGGAIVDLPVFYLEGIVLFPETTIPFKVIQPRLVAAIERAMKQVDAPCVIAVVHYHRSQSDGLQFALVGTTAEIRQYRRLEDGSLNIIARGQQRFHVLKSWIDAEGAPCAQVEIIKEEAPLGAPKDAFGELASIINFRSGSSHVVHSNSPSSSAESSYDSSQIIDSGNSKKRVIMPQSPISYSSEPERADESTGESSDESHTVWFHGSDRHCLISPGRSVMHPLDGGQSDCGSFELESRLGSTASDLQLSPGKSPANGRCTTTRSAWALDESKWLCRAQKSFWPHWVYRMYDAFVLARRAADLWREIIGQPNIDGFVRRPDFLSFFIASKIPVSDKIRQELLEIDRISYRFQREMQLLECLDRVRCKHCMTVIARRRDMVVMSSDGPLNAFVNPYGHVHEIMTLNNAKGLALLDGPVTQHSWFPGYAWTIANCATCDSNMGWLFTATNKRLQPRSFWGIRSLQVSDDLQ
ncbi:uncharacterized protein LOC116256480 [Nymphaea colorata]|nr:uncharacterized protein LOC116256480 [Nymphaea colorata]